MHKVSIFLLYNASSCLFVLGCWCCVFEASIRGDFWDFSPVYFLFSILTWMSEITLDLKVYVVPKRFLVKNDEKPPWVKNNSCWLHDCFSEEEFLLYTTYWVHWIDQFRFIKIRPKTVDLSTRLWGMTTEFVWCIPQSLELRSIVMGLIFIYRNWSIVMLKSMTSCLNETEWEHSCESTFKAVEKIRWELQS